MTTASAVPALRQSVESLMACEHGYALVNIEGLKPPDTLESERGSEVHDVLAKYARHCAKNRVPADFDYLDALAYDKGPEAAEILETCRENIEIDWQNFFAAEVSVGIDKNFNPTYSYDHDGEVVEIDPVWAMEGSGLPPENCGIFDVVYLYPGGKVARIPDYKSHPRAFEADTVQGKRYALMLFMHIPILNEVTFELKFVRYANVKTSVTYYRSDVPRLKEELTRARNRQLNIHAKVAAGQALTCHSGAHCTYCPAITNFTCPIARLNPRTNLTPEERLKYRLWLDVANRVNNEAMRQYVETSGASIASFDENGKAYTFGPVEKTKTTYPLFADDGEGGFCMPIVDALVEWAHTKPEDLKPKRATSRPWFLNLRIGATELNSYLKAKSREIVHNACKARALQEQRIEMRVERDAEVDDGRGEEYREWGDGEAA